MILKQITLSSQAKDQLARLKGRTGIDQWNIFCRWGLSLALREATPPVDQTLHSDSNVTIEWETLLGEYHEVYEALVIQRCKDHGWSTDSKSLEKYFRLQLHRGISYLAAPGMIRTLPNFVGLAIQQPRKIEEEGDDVPLP